jgi:ribosomal protein L7/L12
MPTEIITVTAAVLLVAAILTLLIRAGRAQAARTPITTPTGRLTRDQLDTHLNDLIERKQMIHAIKLLREQTGMGLKDAKHAVDSLAAGRPITHPAYTALPGADLASRVRELKQSGRTDRAIHLVCGETGMNEHDAARFVDSL